MSYDLDLKDITIEKNLAPLPPVLGDRHALQQVVINLLNNAAQAVAENPPERPRVILLTTWVDDRVRMRVTDSGSGIPDAVLPHLFTPFFTTKEPGQGTGLGLSITYSIVDAHGGRITVERPTEGGAAFMVDLPLAPTDAGRHGTPEPQVLAPSLPAATRSILLVDEDPAVRRMVKALFGRDGHRVEVARNPQHAHDLVDAVIERVHTPPLRKKVPSGPTYTTASIPAERPRASPPPRSPGLTKRRPVLCAPGARRTARLPPAPRATRRDRAPPSAARPHDRPRRRRTRESRRFRSSGVGRTPPRATHCRIAGGRGPSLRAARAAPPAPASRRARCGRAPSPTTPGSDRPPRVAAPVPRVPTRRVEAGRHR